MPKPVGNDLRDFVYVSEQAVVEGTMGNTSFSRRGDDCLCVAENDLISESLFCSIKNSNHMKTDMGASKLL